MGTLGIPAKPMSYGDEIDARRVLRRLEREAADPKRTEAARKQLLAMAARKLLAPSFDPLGPINPLDGPALEQVRRQKAECWVNLYQARLSGDLNSAIRATKELRNTIQLEAELLGAMPSRSASQTNVQVNVNTDRDLEELRRRYREAKLADPAVGVAVRELGATSAGPPRAATGAGLAVESQAEDANGTDQSGE